MSPPERRPDAAPDDARDAARGPARDAAPDDVIPDLAPRGADRRKRPAAWMSRFWLRGRRRGTRRADESREIYVDRYERREWLLVVGIMAGCVLDMLLTLDYLDHGGQEWNPLMARALEHGDMAFMGIKLGLTSACLLFLLLRIRFRGVRRAVKLLLGAYLLLLVWHVVVRCTLPESPQVAVLEVHPRTDSGPP